MIDCVIGNSLSLVSVEEGVLIFTHGWHAARYTRHDITNGLTLVVIRISGCLSCALHIRRVAIPLSRTWPSLSLRLPRVVLLLAAARHVPQAIPLRLHPHHLLLRQFRISSTTRLLLRPSSLAGLPLGALLVRQLSVERHLHEVVLLLCHQLVVIAEVLVLSRARLLVVVRRWEAVV